MRREEGDTCRQCSTESRRRRRSSSSSLAAGQVCSGGVRSSLSSTTITTTTTGRRRQQHQQHLRTVLIRGGLIVFFVLVLCFKGAEGFVMMAGGRVSSKAVASRPRASASLSSSTKSAAASPTSTAAAAAGGGAATLTKPTVGTGRRKSAMDPRPKKAAGRKPATAAGRSSSTLLSSSKALVDVDDDAEAFGGEEEVMMGSGSMHLPFEDQLVLARQIKILAKWRAVKATEEERLGRELSIPEWSALMRVTEEGLRQQLRQSMAARSTLITTNFPLVYTMAASAVKKQGKLGESRLSLEDLVNEGTLGIVKAAEKFDPERGVRFTTFACWWIRHCISLAVSHHSNVIRLPLHMQTRMRKVKAARTQLYLELGREPSNKEVAEACDETPDKVNALRRASRGKSYSDVGEAASNIAFKSTLSKMAQADSSINPQISEHEYRMQEEVEAVLSQFAAREQEILRLKWGLDDGYAIAGTHKPHSSTKKRMTIKEIARQCQSSYDKIRKIETRAVSLVQEKRGLLLSQLFQVQPSSALEPECLLVAA